MQIKFGTALLSFYKDKLKLFDGPFKNIKEVSKAINCDEKILMNTIKEYNISSKQGIDHQTGKTVFPIDFSNNINNNKYIICRVTPSLHYTMGGIVISPSTEVQELIESSKSIAGKHRHILNLYAAGECTTGVHGSNRLGGNSLLECVVFGNII